MRLLGDETLIQCGIVKSDELYHYGIPGMKHGVRRWQYEDGRFTPEGKERYFGTKSDGKINDQIIKMTNIKQKNEEQCYPNTQIFDNRIQDTRGEIEPTLKYVKDKNGNLTDKLTSFGKIVRKIDSDLFYYFDKKIEDINYTQKGYDANKDNKISKDINKKLSLLKNSKNIYESIIGNALECSYKYKKELKNNKDEYYKDCPDTELFLFACNTLLWGQDWD